MHSVGGSIKVSAGSWTCHAQLQPWSMPSTCVLVGIRVWIPKPWASAQATLADLLVRMAAEHPHHALYQLFALRAGGRGRGAAAAGAAPAREALVHTVDHDKVAAAAAAIERVAGDHRRQAP